MLNLYKFRSTKENEEKTNGKSENSNHESVKKDSKEEEPAQPEKEPVDLDFMALDYEAMDGHSDNETEVTKVPETSTTTAAKATGNKDDDDSSDDSSSKGMGSEVLDKLRGRSRSGLPSPESEDISRRRDSRKGQHQEKEQTKAAPSSGLSSLAKIYADDGDKEDLVAPGTEDETPKEVAVTLASGLKDNNSTAKSTTDKDSSTRPSGRDKQTVCVYNTISEAKTNFSKTLFFCGYF